jgi:hypothetical protein
MISQGKFNEIELEHGCGYWNICTEHACPCAITTENKGLKQNIWDDFIKENEELAKEYSNNDFEYEPIERCKRCGSLAKESDLYDGLCLECEVELEEEMEED